MGRPKKEFKAITRTYRIPLPDYLSLKLYCEKRKMTINEVLREWIQEHTDPFINQLMEDK